MIVAGLIFLVTPIETARYQRSPLWRIYYRVLLAELEAARDHGRGWFVNHNDVTLTEAYREGARMYDCDGLGRRRSTGLGAQVE